MAKPLTAEGREKKVAAQRKIVETLKGRIAKLKEHESSLAFEQIRLAHLKATPVVEGTPYVELVAEVEASDDPTIFDDESVTAEDAESDESVTAEDAEPAEDTVFA